MDGVMSTISKLCNHRKYALKMIFKGECMLLFLFLSSVFLIKMESFFEA